MDEALSIPYFVLNVYNKNKLARLTTLGITVKILTVKFLLRLTNLVDKTTKTEHI